MGESSSTPTPALHGLTIEAVEWLPSGADSGLVRVRGRWSPDEPAQPGLPWLGLKEGGAEHRFESLPDARFARDPASWRGSYLVPVALVTGAPEALWVEWPGDVRAGLPPLTPGLASPVPAPAVPADEEQGGQLIDRGVLAERRARRAEAAEQTQARVAAEALRAVEALELQSAELERRLGETTAERDALAARAADAPLPPAEGASVAELERLAERRQAALVAALDSLASLRAQTREWRLRLRTGEIAHAGDAVRLAVLEAERSGAVGATRAALRERVSELEAQLDASAAQLAELREQAEGRLEALEAARGELAMQRASAEARAGELRGKVTELEAALAATETQLHAATAAAAATEGRLRVESVARAALEDELDRDRATRAARERELTAAHAARRAAEEAARRSHQQGGALQEQVAELDRRAAGLADEVRLERVARAQAEAAAAAARRPEAESGRMVADLDAAAAALRTSAPAAEVAPVTGPEPEPVPAAVMPSPSHGRATIVSATGAPSRTDVVRGSARRYPALRGALVKLAHDDPRTAGRLLAALLPAQSAALANALDYDLTIRGVGTYAVTVAGTWTHVKPLATPRARGDRDFHLSADALTLAELLAGVERRIGRLRGPARFSGSRRRLNALRALPATRLSLAEAARAGATLEPGLVYRALSYAVHPSWTKGERFTVAQEILDDACQTWYLTARDGAGLAVSPRAPEDGAAATVSMTRGTFDRLLRGEPVPRGERPAVRGDRAVVAKMKTWTDRAQGAGTA